MTQQGRIAGARGWWRSTPPLIRRFSIVLLITGALLAVTGLWLDRTDWWEGHSFFVNLVSSLTSLCFGVPTALLVLSHLGNAQADARRTRRAKDFACAEVEEFHTSLTRIFNVNSVAALDSEVRRLLHDLHRLRQLRDTDGSAAAEFLHAFNALLKLGPAPTAYREPTGWTALSADRWQWRRMESWHVRVETQWRVLSNEVRPMVVDCGLPWLPRSPAAKAEQAIRRLLSDHKRNPWTVERTTLDDQDVVDAMRHFLFDLRVLCTTAKDLAARYPSPASSTAP
ncbi:hypothetical protein ACFY3N_36400 [Streptomyces sp. NPDC000348]|uniref:hypothetical protein n=1 Tax=Streptomyces sp. NPDC000348 TaxID=3364538 RepID=UPI0036793B71